MNPETGNPAPLTLDEIARLTTFLAERGHPDVALEVAMSAVCGAVMASMSEVVTR